MDGRMLENLYTILIFIPLIMSCAVVAITPLSWLRKRYFTPAETVEGIVRELYTKQPMGTYYYAIIQKEDGGMMNFALDREDFMKLRRGGHVRMTCRWEHVTNVEVLEQP